MAESLPEKREAITLATTDSTIALMFALTINASILILAASTFHRTGQTDVAELGQVYHFLAPLLGSAIAPSLFAIALLCCGLNSTVTATMAGQIVMEGFLDIRLPPWLRRLVTRGIAIVPAAAVTIWYGEAGTAKLLILSQVVLSLQLPFAIVPLVMFTADKSKMGQLIAPRWVTGLAVLTALVVIVLNAKLLLDFFATLIAWASVRDPCFAFIVADTAFASRCCYAAAGLGALPEAKIMSAIRIALAIAGTGLIMAACASPRQSFERVVYGDPAKPYLGKTKAEIIACAGPPAGSYPAGFGRDPHLSL